MPARIVLTYRDYDALPADGRRYELHDGERGGGGRSVRVRRGEWEREPQEGRSAGAQFLPVAPASIRRMGRSSRVSGFTMSLSARRLSSSPI